MVIPGPACRAGDVEQGCGAAGAGRHSRCRGSRTPRSASPPPSRHHCRLSRRRGVLSLPHPRTSSLRHLMTRGARPDPSLCHRSLRPQPWHAGPPRDWAPCTVGNREHRARRARRCLLLRLLCLPMLCSPPSRHTLVIDPTPAVANLKALSTQGWRASRHAADTRQEHAGRSAGAGTAGLRAGALQAPLTQKRRCGKASAACQVASGCV